MPPDRWEQIASLYGAALGLPASDRDAFLRENCGHDGALRLELESLLSIAAKPGLLDSTILMEQIKPSAVIGGRFRILRSVGRGGMGVVFEAEDLHLGGSVALKTIRPEIAFTANSIELFKREIQAAKKVTHPNACRIYDLGFHPSPSDPNAQMFLTMEFLEGETLAHRLAAGPLTIKEAAPLVQQMAEALGAAHRAGVIHRDFKSSNVMLTRREAYARAVVMDFGLAGHPADGDQEGSSTGRRYLFGTPEYMAPEQLVGGPVTPATDIYALGIVMYEMVTGHRPFSGATPLDAAIRRLQEAPASPRRIIPHLDSAWETAILRCLEPHPEDRFQTTADLLLALSPGYKLNRTRRRWKRFALIGGSSLAVLAAILIVQKNGRRLPAEAAWQQITDFSDSATDPALSPDGRMLAFKRGGSWFMSTGQIYVKVLPDGQPIQLTHDSFAKMTPAFSPDGTAIDYTVRRPQSEDWEIWQTSVLPRAGEPHLLLSNAEGLTWIDKEHILFSETKSSPDVMAVVTSTGSRSSIRDVYVPRQAQWMAHFSALSPDHKNVLIVEMDPVGGGHGYSNFAPCRLAPFDGSSTGRLVGPVPGHCIAAAWSPDGKWMYFSARATDKFHLWRQRTDRDQPEQITYGPTGEEGLTIAADGRSAITSVGVDQYTVWIHDGKGERQISGEGSATSARISADGSRLFYLSAPDLWAADLRSGRLDRVLPGVPVTDYSLSPDSKAIAYVTTDGSLWYAPIDLRTAPRRLSMRARQPEFTRSGDILFRISSTVYSIHPDGANRRQAPGNPGDESRRSAYQSPDEQWYVRGVDNGLVVAEHRSGSPRIPLCDRCLVHWTLDGRFFWMSLRSLNGEGITGIFRLGHGAMLPALPRGGVKSAAELMEVPGAQIVPSDIAFPAPDGSGYAFLKQESRWNLYRIPLP